MERNILDVIEKLRTIRDKAWQFSRCHHEYGRIEFLAEQALKELGIQDGPPYPNPRTGEWWNNKQ